MPVLLRYRGYRFFFYAFEGDPREPPHIHVRKAIPKPNSGCSPLSASCITRTCRRASCASCSTSSGASGQCWKGHGMRFLSPKLIRFDEDMFWVDLDDGRTIGVPLAWFPRLLDATPAQRLDYELSPFGMHWDELDEDISVEGILLGFGDMTRRRSTAPIAAE